MRRLWLVALLSLGLAGCGGPEKTNADSPRSAVTRAPAKASTKAPKLIVTPGGTLPGKVVLVNAAGRYVVLSFPMGTLPPPDQRLNVYRGGLKVGVLKITGAPRDLYTVGDIIYGECQVGDEVKEN